MDAVLEDRSTRLSIQRGLMCRCPACGEGRLFSSYLKVVPACPHCGEQLHHQRADDGPAYLTMLVVCKVAGIMLHLLFAIDGITPLTVFASINAVIIPMSLIMLPRMKGFMVGIQWAKRMHGFGLAAVR
ncbi:MAG: DUF983 domain-containing protein [Gemmobacter sp.]